MSSSMEEEEENPTRWTCEACGCNTNQQSDRSCTICGTSNSGPSIMRRHGAAYAARVGWIARGLRRGMQDEIELDEEEFWESVVDNMEMAAGDSAESAIESLAMEVSNRNRGRLLNNAGGRRLLEAARAFSQIRESPDPAELLSAATAAAAAYQPRWADPSQLCARGRNGGNDIQVGEGSRQNLAHLPSGAGEGRAIRAEDPLPKAEPFGSLAQAGPQGARRVIGFRVAFDHPSAETGGNMGGCHLLGVTTSSFTAYGDQNGLQQSPFFWGIDDGGQKYEGSQYNGGRSARRTYSNFRNDFVSQDAPLNAANVLFGCREVITVVCDYESRTLTFWRDGNLLGTLVTNLPRSGNLYPVAVPFNCGVTVAITGLNEDPLPLLRAFAVDCLRTQQGREDSLRQQLLLKRARLIVNGGPTAELTELLKTVFFMYKTDLNHADPVISYTLACRLWYRCGMRISSLNTLLEQKNTPYGEVTLNDFFSIVCKVIAADAREHLVVSALVNYSGCEVGDKVELVEGYEKYGDSSGGPLHPGDRGTVVELQRGPNGERRSVRVLHNGRRWWYQPQAIVSERSGLIESPAVWFINKLLRSHGFDCDTLTLMHGKPVTTSSWRIGDTVAPRKPPVNTAVFPLKTTMIGRIVSEVSGNTPRTAVTTHNRDAGTVLVEFIGHSFLEAVGLKTPTAPENNTGVLVRRVRVSKLLHSTVLYHVDDEASGGSDELSTSSTMRSDAGSLTLSSSAPASDKLQAEIAAVGRLEQSSIDTVAKECKKSSDTLASLFSAGLPEAVLSAIDVAAKQMNSLEPREDLFEKIAAIGGLITAIAEKLYAKTTMKDVEVKEPEQMDTDSMLSENADRAALFPAGIVASRQGSRPVPAARAQDMASDFSSNLPQLVNASLQQRRGMLFSLLSRGGRRRGPAMLNDLNERRNAIDAGLGQGPSPFGINGAPPFMIGSPLSNDPVVWDGRSLPEPVVPVLERPSDDAGILDAILRCRGDSTDALNGSLKQGGRGPSFFAFIRRLVACGILANSHGWVEALIDSFQCKGNQLTAAQRPSSSLLRGAVDEDGTPILQLAVLLGCNIDVIRQLISCGSSVGPDEIKKAAFTDQPRTLAVLLQHTSYCEGVIPVDQCSDEVLAVLQQATARQDELDRQMRDAAGAFVASVVKKLISLGLASRRNQSTRTAICNKVICGILVGDVLLRALQVAQKPTDSMGSNFQEQLHPPAGGNGRVPVEDCSTNLTPEGVLRFLPPTVLGGALFFDTESATTFFLLLEEFLCSKEMPDAATGLTLLSILLTNFSQIRSTPILERYGLADLVSFHDVLASNRIAEILSKEFTAGLDVSSGCTGDSPCLGPRQDKTGLVVCPKKHTALLHITRHSSFRCDVCGCGVDRGRPMHGCRECDWDACEECTDKSESGLIKCTAIREIACDCLKMMSDVNEEDKNLDFPFADVLEKLSGQDSTVELNAIAIRLLQHDVEAIRELGFMLQEQGRVSFHQFFSVVLPALHASLSGRSTEMELGLLNTSSRHKNKKARVAGCNGYSLSPDDRFEYCRAAVHCLLEDNEQESENDAKNAADEGATQVEANASRNFTGEHTSVLGSGTSDPKLKSEIAYSTLASELLRRIHQVLSLYEGVTLFSSSVRSLDVSGGDKGGDLHTLTKSIEIQLTQYSLTDVGSSSRNKRLKLDVEPLVPVSDIELHVLRSCRIDDPSYLSFCQALAVDAAVIIEKALSNGNDSWRVARVVGYNERTGGHVIQYASHLPQLGQGRSLLDVRDIAFEDERSIVFDGAVTNLILAARKYVIIHRRKGTTFIHRASCSVPPVVDFETISNCPADLVRAVGSRVESNCGNAGVWNVYTLVGIDTDSLSRSKKGVQVVLVSDEGVVFSGVPSDQIRYSHRGHSDDASRESETSAHGRLVSDERNALRRSFPFTFTTRQRNDDEGATLGKAATLKRTWSAISLATSMRSIDIPVTGDRKSLTVSEPPVCPTWLCQIGAIEIKLMCCSTAVEIPPKLTVKFSASDKLPSVSLSTMRDTTISHALALLHRRQGKWREWPSHSSFHLYFTLGVDSATNFQETDTSRTVLQLHGNALDCDDEASRQLASKNAAWSGRAIDRSRKLSARSLSPEDNDKASNLREGLDEICFQCMDVIGILSQHAEDTSESLEPDRPRILGFANPALSKKLTDQLDDSLCVVGGALPEWCTTAPAFAPRTFSYNSRQMLLQRAAFGVSRSTLKQQEAKVNVGRLRQRMASLRARAVELMGEAFSGGAEDPTALQLQADELYGMEETLATRVRAAFRAAKWQEHSIQVAKAAVRRDSILSDAAAIMERYAKDETVNRRRLEVRFDGETGFDAASGDEAGVTRGFYADVAEALLSSEIVAGAVCSSSCARSKVDSMEIDDGEEEDEQCKLPLWIPDMDTSSLVVIPTPRADSRSNLGVYPKPLPSYHPQLPEVLQYFRFMGRLFAAAMRDGFMFPLPLSASFLKLVQHAPDSISSTGDSNLKPASPHDLLLTMADLPRPGFLGGEVYAADVHICRALDALDALDPPLSRVELQRRYQEIATNKDFARIAFGMSYDYSFEDYFQDRTFVDPLDPSQGDEAVPLCSRGHKKAVTIYNVREWVALAKRFVLHDGVIAQAVAFRQGTEDFFPSKFLRIFTAEELQRDVCGSGDNVDNWDENAVRKLFKLNGGKGAAEALVAVAAIGGEGGAVLSRRFGPSSPTIAFLVKALLEASPKQRRQFLSFVTSVPIVTPGRIEVVPMVSPSGEFLPMRDPTCLPRANTCARRLYLPKFDTYESFSQVLWAVVREESRFKGFYEWRGAS